MKKKILIVEDNADLLKVLQLLLKYPFEAIPAMKGAEAVDIAATERPDLILLDVVLPDMNGFEIARLMRQRPETKSTPILAMTAKVSRIDEEECILSGCDDFIAKPFTFEQLLPRIEKLLNQSDHQS